MHLDMPIILSSPGYKFPSNWSIPLVTNDNEKSERQNQLDPIIINAMQFIKCMFMSLSRYQWVAKKKIVYLGIEGSKKKKKMRKV